MTIRFISFGENKVIRSGRFPSLSLMAETTLGTGQQAYALLGWFNCLAVDLASKVGVIEFGKNFTIAPMRPGLLSAFQSQRFFTLARGRAASL
ncbi:hypothetical protein [Nodosilinea sp. LEGE 06152]|uniref:hypothetical protein n=1 Tax=Nodosilinea sp. LEGE 06152 TaxID=2777966 RepID=UPI00187E87DE|nr:hypothetical protein [Nodosilinea sp. LEGE 06152]